MLFYHIILLFLASFVAAETTETSASSSSSSSSSSISTVLPTLVWVTGTDQNGVTQTTQSAYTQAFTSFYVSVVSPSSGNVGVGSITGTVGAVRTYTQSTVNGAMGNHAGQPMGIFFTRIIPLFSALMGLFML
ncbi:Killer toxin-resistance protein 1 [Metschnikowia aff. pulcherrima]|uniref:Killer toxin-resistance protein 1 n=1 Tax=Metschnikowia aff. pulcherrima TaxID=2163413 RepID=A0A4P6XU26_9ASCO|nr:Killer toxin-resistance protein 1 [Metschnikowia aff. pulcherrima]